MSYNAVEVSVLAFLRPQVGTKVTGETLYKELKKNFPELTENKLAVTMNVLTQEGLMRGQISDSLDRYLHITEAGLKAVRREHGAVDYV